MGKPPFKYKPNKAPTAAGAGQIQTVGSDEVLAMYSDVFIVANEAGTNMANLYFYQRGLPDRSAVLGGTETGITIVKAKCVGRIILSPEAADKFLEALAENRGFSITRKKEQKQ